MATTFAILSIDSSGVAVFQNGTGNADPLNVWLERGTPGVLVQGSWGEVDANAQGWTYVGAQTGDIPFAQRLNATSPVKGPAVPAPATPPPPPPPAPVTLVTEPTVSGTLQAGDKLTATPGTYLNEVSVTQQWLSGTPANQGVLAGQTVVGTGLTYTLGTADVGNQITLAETATGGTRTTPITDYVWGTTPVAEAVPPPPVNPPPPPVVTGLITGPFFASDDPFRRLLPAVRVVDPLSAGWVSKYIGTTGIKPGAGTNVTGSSLATGTDGWPIYEAKSTDQEITITGTSAYGTATLHCPVGVVPQAPVGGDAHLIIIEPVGVSPTHPTMVVVTEFYQAVVQNGVVVRATGVQQFNASTNAPINALTAQLLSEPGSCRGCGSSCLDGPVLESEYLAGVQGIQHALCFTAPWAQGLVNGVKQYRSPVAIIGSPGGPADGVPYGACIDIDPAYDITQVSAVLQPLAWAIQNYGAYVTDNTDLNTGLGFQAQAGSGKSAAYQSLDGGNALNGLPWAHMRVLRSWNGQ